MKKTLAILCILLTISTGAVVLQKYLIEYFAKSVTFKLTEGFETIDDQQFIVEMTKRIHRNYVFSGQSSKPYSLLYKIKPYLTSALIPNLLRIQVGAIDAIYMRGLCDSASRALAFLLNNSGRNIQAYQLNMISPYAAHSVTGFVLNGREFFVDPLFAVVPMSGNNLIGLDQVKKNSLDRDERHLIWHPIEPTSRLEFYQNFDKISCAPSGSKIQINAQVSPLRVDQNYEIRLGALDGGDSDVGEAAAKLGWSPYWTYLGSRYDRAWERVLAVSDNTEITFILTEPLNSNFITTRQKPIVEGKYVKYNLKAGEQLVLQDGMAKRDWKTLRSYQPIDAIILKRKP